MVSHEEGKRRFDAAGAQGERKRLYIEDRGLLSALWLYFQRCLEGLENSAASRVTPHAGNETEPPGPFY